MENNWVRPQSKPGWKQMVLTKWVKLRSSTRTRPSGPMGTEGSHGAFGQRGQRVILRNRNAGCR